MKENCIDLYEEKYLIGGVLRLKISSIQLKRILWSYRLSKPPFMKTIRFRHLKFLNLFISIVLSVSHLAQLKSGRLDPRFPLLESNWYILPKLIKKFLLGTSWNINLVNNVTSNLKLLEKLRKLWPEFKGTLGYIMSLICLPLPKVIILSYNEQIYSN